MKILVTGGAGFIGSHVADIYLAEGHSVWVLDNLSGGKIANLPKAAKFIKLDLRDRAGVEKLLKKEKKEMNFHGKANFGPARRGDLKANWLSFAKAKRELAWQPKTSLALGIAKTADYFRALE